MKVFGFDKYVKMPMDHLNTKKKWAWKPVHWPIIKKPKSLLKYNSKIDLFSASKSNPKFILILSRYTTSTGALLRALKKTKTSYVYVNWDEFIHKGTILYEKDGGELNFNGKKINLKNVKNIFYDYNELSEVFFFKRSIFSNKEKIFISRWLDCLKAIEFICKKAQWFPASPSILKYESQNKYGESIEARKLGLLIPKMIYTNDIFKAQSFLVKYESILKESGISFIEDKQKNLYGLSPYVVKVSDDLSGLIAPCLFQERIAKRYDIRSVVVGKSVYSTKIESQKNEKTKLDWRMQEHLVPFQKYNLPKNIEKKLVQLSSRLGLKFTCCDLIKGIDGNYYFLEMNRPGHWFYLEVLSGVPISKALAKILK